MKQKTKTSKQTKVQAVSTTEPVVYQTSADLKNAVLVVSLFINLFMLTGWLVIETTNYYNGQLIAYLLR